MSSPNTIDIPQLVNSTILSLSSLSINTSQIEEIRKNIQNQFSQMNDILFVKKDDNLSIELINYISNSAFIFVGFSNLLNLTVEERKQFTIIFTGSISQHDNDGKYPVADFIKRNVIIIYTLLGFYERP